MVKHTTCVHIPIGMFERPSVHHPSRVSEASNGKEEGEEGEGQGEEGEGQGEEGEGQGEDNEGEEEEDLGFFRPADTDSDSEVCSHQILAQFQSWGGRGVGGRTSFMCTCT